MYMQQMLCLVTDDYNDAAEFGPQALRTALDKPLAELGFVHFASLALLPPLPGAAGRPSLMLELVVDDGIAPREAVCRVFDAMPGALWTLYERGALPADDAARRPLRDRLETMADAARAHGGFVGIRDRTVTQVRAERRWFLQARDAVQRILRQPAGGAQRDPADLVRRLVTEMADDPGSAAMGAPPARSMWREPLPAALRLLLTLVWLVLPIPLLVCVLALVGWLAEGVAGMLPGEPVALLGGGVAALTLLLSLLAGFAVVGSRQVAVSVVVAGVTVVGTVLFHAGLVTAFLGTCVARLRWPTESPTTALGAVCVLIALLAAAALAARRIEWGSTVARRARTALGVLGALAAAGLFGVAFNDTLDVGLSAAGGGRWLRLLPPYAVSFLLALVLMSRSSTARWYFALVLPLIGSLLVVGIAAYATWPDLATWLGTGADLRRRLAVGVLAHAALVLLVAMSAVLWLASRLRAPRWPIGRLLLAALVVLGAAYLGISAWAHKLLSTNPDLADLLSVLGRPLSLLWAALSLALAGLLVLGLHWLAAVALPRLEDALAELDRVPTTEPYLPCELPPAIVANEAALSGRPSHLISLSDVRGRGRGLPWLMIWLWLHVVGEVGHIHYARGLLGTAAGIKFAHWHLVQGGRRLLFVSNFDGDFGGYLDEFIGGASQGINLIWRWTHLLRRPALLVPGAPLQAGVSIDRRYPQTRKWAFGGCRHEQHFKAYARASMIPHLYMFQAYQQTNDDIERQTQLREALIGERTPVKDDQALRALES